MHYGSFTIIKNFWKIFICECLKLCQNLHKTVKMFLDLPSEVMNKRMRDPNFI